MAITFYNTLGRKKQAFRPLESGKVLMYNCGPTVYDYAHIGNLRSYIFADLLRRMLESRGFSVRQVMNITDVDDKTIRGSIREKLSLKDYTSKYEKAFFEDLDTLNIKRASVYPRATEHIDEMVSLVSTLLDKGMAYRRDDGVYFDISSFKAYGKLAGLEKAELKAGARVSQDEYDKDNAQDFALWKAWEKKDGDVFWETPIGKGRPGWHIECSAMSQKHLGKTIDIHTGGVDLIFPHHENEIAQSQGSTGKPFVRYWMHNEHLLVNGRKMSKSAGNFYTLRDLLSKGYSPMAIRYALLSAHYRQKLDLSMKVLDAAEQSVSRLKEFADKLRTGQDSRRSEEAAKKAFSDFSEAMDNDLDMPKALSIVFNLARDLNRSGGGPKAMDVLMKMDSVLGLDLGEEVWKQSSEAPEHVREMMAEREDAREARDFKRADSIRESLRKKGILLEDRRSGTVWRKG